MTRVPRVAWIALVSMLTGGVSGAGAAAVEEIAPSDPRVLVMGRADRSDPARLRVGYPGVTLRLRFEGEGLTMRVACDTPDVYVAVQLDGGAPRVVRLAQGESRVRLAEGLGAGAHTVEVVHRNETWQGVLEVRGILPAPGGRLLAPDPFPRRRLLFVGDSVTCGEGVGRGPECVKDAAASCDAGLSYGMLLARRLDAQAHLVCYGGRGLLRDWQGRRDVPNAPRFFDLAVPRDHDAPAWDHAAYTPDAIVISLGTNDFNLALGALPEREEYVAAYVAFVRDVRARHPLAHLFLTEGAIVNDEADPARPQKTVLRAYLAEAARRLGDARLQVVSARHYPGDACDAHPTREQHEAMANDLEPWLRAELGWWPTTP